MNSLVFSKLYYCSFLWSNISASNICKLQGVQNCIASRTRKFGHLSLALKNLRWIPVKSHLYLREALLVLKSMTGQVPNYLRSNLSPEGTSVVEQPDHLPSLIYRFLKPSRNRDLFITELSLGEMP